MPRAMLNMVMAVTLVSRNVLVSFKTWCHAPLLCCTFTMAEACVVSSVIRASRIG